MVATKFFVPTRLISLFCLLFFLAKSAVLFADITISPFQSGCPVINVNETSDGATIKIGLLPRELGDITVAIREDRNLSFVEAKVIDVSSGQAVSQRSTFNGDADPSIVIAVKELGLDKSEPGAIETYRIADIILVQPSGRDSALLSVIVIDKNTAVQRQIKLWNQEITCVGISDIPELNDVDRFLLFGVSNLFDLQSYIIKIRDESEQLKVQAVEAQEQLALEQDENRRCLKATESVLDRLSTEQDRTDDLEWQLGTTTEISNLCYEENRALNKKLKRLLRKTDSVYHPFIKSVRRYVRGIRRKGKELLAAALAERAAN